ncbi:MAG: lipoate protein ligase C-terminal domain-containing protein [Candidatus Bathyarchaeia archaeon]|nr:hypothetical protein [Candidatus Bathyarchaeota archaeon]
MLRAEYKVEGGKLIKVQLTKQNDKIGSIKITGDFFMHPEEAIEGLEIALIGCPINEIVLASTIRNFINENKVILLGATPEDFAKCIIKAGGGSG